MTRISERAAGAPASRASPWSRLVRQVGFLVPGLDEIRDHGPLLAPLTLVALFSLTAAFSIQPLVFEAMGGEEGRTLAVVLWATAALSPLLVGARALILALLGWSGLVLGGRDARFRPLLSVFLYGEAILALQGVAMVLVLHLRGSGSVTGPADLHVPLGLDALVASEMPWAAGVAQTLSPLHLAWAGFVWVALRRSAGLSSGTSAAVTAMAWTFVAALAVIRALAAGGM